MQFSDPAIRYWLSIIYMPGIGPVTFRHWLSHFSTIQNLFDATEKDLQNLNFKPNEIALIKNPDWKSVEKDIAWAEKTNTHLIHCEDKDYPRLLKEIHDAPLLLYVQGDKTLLSKPQIAIVGSRHPTATGANNAEQFAHTLSQSGCIITSGMALGIDTAAHRGALKANKKTIAVMGAGLNHIYPPSNQLLSEEIKNHGALVSEFSPLLKPKASYFPQRNRIISGLSTGVLIVEAALRSGSLMTARYAMEQGREVFAIPGSIHNPLARGCHSLIRQGAKLVETAEDIMEELSALINWSLNSGIPRKNELECTKIEHKHQKLLTHIGYEATPLDLIIQRSGLTPGQVSSMLLSLELNGHIQSVSGGYTLTKTQV